MVSATTTVNGERRTVKSDPFNHQGSKCGNFAIILIFIVRSARYRILPKSKEMIYLESDFLASYVKTVYLIFQTCRVRKARRVTRGIRQYGF